MSADSLDRRVEPASGPPLFGPPPGIGRQLWVVTALATVALIALQSWHVGVDSWAVVTGLVLIAAGGAALLPATEPGGGRLAAGWAWGAATAVALAQLATLWDPAHGDGNEYAPWYVRGATIVCAVVILRGRAGAGWTGALIGYLAAATIGVASGDLVGQWSVLTLRQIATLIGIQVFAIMLARAERANEALWKEERARQAAIQLRDAVARQRQEETERIRSLARATLQRIADGEESIALRQEAMLLEGTLRDTMRGRRLAVTPVAQAARAARARGVDVVLLDDLTRPSAEHTPEAVPDSVLAWLAARLAAAAPPRATARLATGVDSGPEVSFYSEAEGSPPERMPLEPIGAETSPTAV